jgi:excisionase family DNA binding protein
LSDCNLDIMRAEWFGERNRVMRCQMSVDLRATPLLVSLRAAAKLMSLSERTVWAMTDDGRLPSVRAGRRRLISVAALESWIARQQSAVVGTEN